MEELKLLKTDARIAFDKGTSGDQALLKRLFPKEFVSDMRELIQSFEAACEYNNTNPKARRFTEGTESGIYQEMIAEISKALNGGKVMKGGEERWCPYFEYSAAGFRFIGAHYDDTYADAASGPRLCLKNKELAVYSGTKFLPFWDKFLNSEL
jgi:hypothetical protein